MDLTVVRLMNEQPYSFVGHCAFQAPKKWSYFYYSTPLISQTDPAAFLCLIYQYIIMQFTKCEEQVIMQYQVLRHHRTTTCTFYLVQLKQQEYKRTVMGGDLFLSKFMFTLTMDLEILLGRYLQQSISWYWNIPRMHK